MAEFRKIPLKGAFPHYCAFNAYSNPSGRRFPWVRSVQWCSVMVAGLVLFAQTGLGQVASPGMSPLLQSLKENPASMQWATESSAFLGGVNTSLSTASPKGDDTGGGAGQGLRAAAAVMFGSMTGGVSHQDDTLKTSDSTKPYQLTLRERGTTLGGAILLNDSIALGGSVEISQRNEKRHLEYFDSTASLDFAEDLDQRRGTTVFAFGASFKITDNLYAGSALGVESIKSSGSLTLAQLTPYTPTVYPLDYTASRNIFRAGAGYSWFQKQGFGIHVEVGLEQRTPYDISGYGKDMDEQRRTFLTGEVLIDNVLISYTNSQKDVVNAGKKAEKIVDTALVTGWKPNGGFGGFIGVVSRDYIGFNASNRETGSTRRSHSFLGLSYQF